MSWEERMAARARQRERALAESIWLARPVEERMCRTGDGNFEAGPDTHLCVYCLNREYGTSKMREPGDGDHCDQCWEPRLVWQGAWYLLHIPPGVRECTHSCHDDEIGLAAAS
jgi:hypothetical protein